MSGGDEATLDAQSSMAAVWSTVDEGVLPQPTNDPGSPSNPVQDSPSPVSETQQQAAIEPDEARLPASNDESANVPSVAKTLAHMQEQLQLAH